MNASIMIVEDEEALTLLLRYNLETQGYEVETITRGDEADTRLKEGTPDLTILDWMLPGLSAIELCRRLRARPAAGARAGAPRAGGAAGSERAPALSAGARGAD